MWKRAAIYGVMLAAGTVGLQSLDYLRLTRVHSSDVYIFLIATAFLALGVFVGARVMGARRRRTAIATRRPGQRLA